MKILIPLLFVFLSQSVLANKCIDLMKKEDFYAAVDVCKSMANKGDKDAQFSLGILYYGGQGMMSDQGEAHKWWRKAARQNLPEAQYNLGIMIANGQGGEADLVEAYAWLKIAAENGYKPAIESVDQLGAELSSKEKKQSVERIVELKKQVKR